jgi:hypothetical protein
MEPATPVDDPHPTVDNPDIIKTLTTPSTNPYGLGGGGGGGGGTGNKTIDSIIGPKRNWTLLVAGIVAVTGFIFFNPKTKIV